MKTIIGILISLLFSGCYTKLAAENVDNKEKMALLRQLSRTAPNDTIRLNLLYQIRLSVSDPQVEAYYINWLLKEAEAMNQTKYVCKAYLAYMALAYNNYNADEVNRWMKIMEPIARRDKLYDELFLGQRCVVDMIMISGEYEREEKEAKKMLAEAQKMQNSTGIVLAYQCLSNVYRITYRQNEAAEVLKKAYDALNSDEGLNIEIIKSLVATYQEMPDLPNWLKWIKVQDNYLNQIIKKDPKAVARLRGWLMMTYISYLSYYTKINDYNQAEKYLVLAEKYAMNDYDTFNYNYCYARYCYFNGIEQWEKALQEIERLVSMFETSPINYNIFVGIKAKILHRLNRDNEALAIYKQTLALRDSVNLDILGKQSVQMRKDYKSDQLLLENEKISRNIRWVFLSLIVVVLVILIIFIVHTYKTRKGLMKSEQEMRRMVDEVEQANTAKELFLSTISTTIGIPMNEVVNGSMALAANTVTDIEERKKLSATINETSAKLMRLINNILDLSRLEAGMMKYREEENDLILVIRNLLDTMPETMRQRITVSMPQEGSFVKCMDAVRLQEVFNNLIQTSFGEISIKIEFSDNNRVMRICVIGSVLSSAKQSQEIEIANEVNRLIVEHFNGRYELLTDIEPHQVCFEFALLKK